MVDYDDLPETRPAPDVAAELDRLADRLRAISRRPRPWYEHASPVAAALTGALAVGLVGCLDVDCSGLAGLAGSVPGVLAAVAAALRAQSRIRVADAERERIVAEAHADAMASLAETMRGLRADLDTAGNVARDALARERECERRLRTLDARCDALAAELSEVRRAVTAGRLS